MTETYSDDRILDPMAERRPKDTQRDLNWLGVVSQALKSSEVESAFASGSPEERNSFVKALEQSLKDLRRIQNQINREKRISERLALAKRLGIDGFGSQDLNYRPHVVIERVFRRGKYLDFSSVDEGILTLYSKAIQRSVKEYKEHIEEFGEYSLAHLCLPYWDLRGFSRGVSIQGPNADRSEVVHVNTIDELREILKLKSSGGITRVHGRNMLVDRLREALERWDAIPEESDSPAQETG